MTGNLKTSPSARTQMRKAKGKADKGSRSLLLYAAPHHPTPRKASTKKRIFLPKMKNLLNFPPQFLTFFSSPHKGVIYDNFRAKNYRKFFSHQKNTKTCKKALVHTLLNALQTAEWLRTKLFRVLRARNGIFCASFLLLFWCVAKLAFLLFRHSGESFPLAFVCREFSPNNSLENYDLWRRILARNSGLTTRGLGCAKRGGKMETIIGTTSSRKSFPQFFAFYGGMAERMNVDAMGCDVKLLKTEPRTI